MRLRLLCPALWLLAAPAAADVVGPEESIDCPSGAQASTNHCGTICYAAPCETDADCGSGERCANVPYCVEELMCGGWGGTITAVRGSCAEGCSEGTCGEVRTCLDEDLVAPDGTVPRENVTYGCGCRVGTSGSGGGLGLMALLALALLRRRR